MLDLIPPPDPNSSWFKLLLYTAFAALGGLLGHLFRTIDKGLKVSWRRAVIEGMGAGFVGLMFCLLCRAMQLSEEWTGVIVGVTGWLGATASIKLIESAVYKKLGINKGNDVPATPTEGPQDEEPVQ